jgi:hypothetical protein
VGVYTTLEGDINYKGRFPRDNLGNPIIYQGVRFLDQSGLLRLNRYMAATFLIGEYDEECYTLEVDAAILRELVQSAEQLTADQRWRRILAYAVRSWLGGRQLRPPPRLMAPS